MGENQRRPSGDEPGRNDHEEDAPGSDRRAKVVDGALTAALSSVAVKIAEMSWDALHRQIERLPGGPLAVIPTVGLLLAFLLRFSPRLGAIPPRVLRWSVGRATRVIRAIGWPARLTRWMRRLRGWLARVRAPLAVGYLAACFGAAVAFVGLLLTQTVGGPCDPPQELRVITAQENVSALRERSEEYTAENRTWAGCAPFRISVGAAPSVDEMIKGFGNRWHRDYSLQENAPYFRLLGLTPDAWIAGSSAEVDYVREGVSTEGKGVPGESAELVKGPSVATEGMVFATFARVDELEQAVAASDGNHELENLVPQIRSLGMHIVYPQPGLSSAGLVAAAYLVDLTEAAGDAPENVNFDTSVSALLCRMRGDADQQFRNNLVLVVPSHSVVDYNRGRDMAQEDCPKGASDGSYSLNAISSPGLPALDHPFVKIDWSGNNDPARGALLDDFAGWLADRGLFGGGKPEGTPGEGGAADAGAAKSRKLDARVLKEARPKIAELFHQVKLRIMLDVSGSMPWSADASNIRDAFSRMKQTLITDDRLSVGMFSRKGNGELALESVRLPDVATGEARPGNLDALLQRITLDDGPRFDAPISQMLEGLDDLLPGRSVAVVTDGGIFNDEIDPERAAQTIDAALSKSESVQNLYILVLGGQCPAGVSAPAPALSPSAHDTPKDKRMACDLTTENDIGDALTRMISKIREWS